MRTMSWSLFRSAIRAVLLAPTGALAAVVRRNRSAVALAVFVALVSSTTAAAVSYLNLGTTNSASAMTTLSSSTNAAVLSLRNTNSAGGTSARGLGITVPAGRPPIVVNSSAGKATNLDADKLDGYSSSAFGRVRDFSRTVNAVGVGRVDMLTFLGLTVTAKSYIESNLLYCELYASATGAGQFDIARVYGGGNSQGIASIYGTATPTAGIPIGSAVGSGTRSVGQLIYRNATLGETISVAYSVYGIPDADINYQGCTWQGTVTAPGL